MPAVLTRISEAQNRSHIPSYVRGQSLGSIISLKGSTMTLGRLTEMFMRLTDNGESNNVSVQIIGSHTDIGLHCFSITFHFLLGSRAAAVQARERSLNSIREWLREQFASEEVEMREFASRIELCNYTRTFLPVM